MTPDDDDGLSIDYDYLILKICQVFGWTINGVLSLTLPQFRCVSEKLLELTADKARDEVFLGVAAALCSNKVRDTLFKSCGSILKKDDGGPGTSRRTYTRRELEAATRRMEAIIQARVQEKSSDEVN